MEKILFLIITIIILLAKPFPVFAQVGECSTGTVCSRYWPCQNVFNESCSIECPENYPTKCNSQDYLGEGYSFSCCSQPTPGDTPPPEEIPPAPDEWICSSTGLVETQYYNSCSHFADWMGLTCSSDSCGNTNPYKCFSWNGYNSSPQHYLYSCCAYDCETSNIPGPGITPQPTPNPQIPPDAIPLPIVPCDSTRDNEFHSLRPYQASPCNRNVEDTAMYCGNSLTVVDDVNFTYGSSYSTCVNDDDVNCCSPSGVEGEVICRYYVSNERDIVVNLEDAEFPIMGYTEPSANEVGSGDPEVINSLQPRADESLSIEARMNEYVSWYLNGVNERAEYSKLDMDKNCIGESTKREGICRWYTPTHHFGPITVSSENNCINNVPGWQFDGGANCPAFQQCCISTLIDKEVDMLDRDKLINFSGPLKKLLPLRIHIKERVEEINQAGGSRHNQIAGCTYGISLPTPSGEINIGAFPGACYLEGLLDVIYNFNPPGPLQSLRQRRRLDDWENHQPPVEENYQNDTWIDFLNDYREWRGQACVSVQIPQAVIDTFLPLWARTIVNQYFAQIGTFFVCFDNPLSPNFWSSIYNFVPMSSTEDRIGTTTISGNTRQPSQQRLRFINVKLTNTDPAFLYFPHMEESLELADTLQQTFVYRFAIDSSTETSRVAPAASDRYCDLIDIRSNPGDNLFAGTISTHLSYEAVASCEFYDGTGDSGQLCNASGGECVNPNTACSTYYGNVDCPSGQVCADSCTNNDPGGTYCTASGGTCVPDGYDCSYYVDPDDCNPGYVCGMTCSISNSQLPAQTCTVPIRITLDLVTNTPLANEVWARLVAGPVSVVKRIFPLVGVEGSMDLYSDLPAASPVTYETTGNIIIGNPTSYRSGAELYFPHIGGIKEYFLTGIQTALRPLGFGEPISFGTPDEDTSSDDDGTIIGGTCSEAGGYCSTDSDSYLSTVWGAHASNASQICLLESSANPMAVNYNCVNGTTYDFSVGLFQINLVPYEANGTLNDWRCPGAFNLDINQVQPPYCDIIDDGTDCSDLVPGLTECNATLRQCIINFQNPDYNTDYAWAIYQTGGWCAWAYSADTCSIEDCL